MILYVTICCLFLCFVVSQAFAWARAGGDVKEFLEVNAVEISQKPTTIDAYNSAQNLPNHAICNLLNAELSNGIPKAESKIWHGGPVWFLAGNPISGYWVRKSGVQLLFWSGQSFDEASLKPEGKFKAAQVLYKDVSEINLADVRRWLAKATLIQWDYKNIVKRKGHLEKLGAW